MMLTQDALTIAPMGRPGGIKMSDPNATITAEANAHAARTAMAMSIEQYPTLQYRPMWEATFLPLPADMNPSGCLLQNLSTHGGQANKEWLPATPFKGLINVNRHTVETLHAATTPSALKWN